ncbi:MAG: Ig-like domain-containing protein, partial [Chloroflexota bacterium]
MNRLQPLTKPRNLSIAILALLLLIAGILFGPMAFTGPQIIHTTPEADASDANPQTGIQLTFNQWVRPDAVAAAVRFDPPTDFTVVAEGITTPWHTTMLIQLQDGLQYGTDYTLSLEPSISNILGRTLEQEHTIAFTTAPYVAIEHFGPEEEAIDVALNAPVVIEFDTPIVSEDAISASAEDPTLAGTLPGSGGADSPLFVSLVPEVEGIGRWLSPQHFGFYPQTPLDAAATYEVTVESDITGDGQAQLEEEMSWTFTTEAPLVSGTRPYDGAIDIATDSAIEVQLAEDVDTDSATEHFQLINMADEQPIDGQIETTHTGFRFVPTSTLQRSARYQAHFTPGVQSTSGAELNPDPLTWSFDVIGDLEVAQVEPPVDANQVLTDTRRISVHFNHPVVSVTTIDGEQDHVTPLEITPTLPGEGRWLNTSTYVFSPTTALAPSTRYEVSIADGLEDQTGGVLQTAFNWSFQTITPQVEELELTPDSEYTSPDEPIRVIFNQTMDSASIGNALAMLRDDTNAAVAGTIDVDGHVVTFTPAAPLERGARYRVVVAAGADAAEGTGSLESDYTQGFRVAPLPRLTSSTPNDGAQSANPREGINLTFSTPMDWSSLEQNMTITPEPTDVYTSAYNTNFSFYFDLAPETDYQVTIDGTTRDAFGAPMRQETAISFRTAPLEHAISLISSNQIGVYNAYAPTRVPVRSVNVENVSYSLYELSTMEVPELANDFNGWNNFQPDPETLLDEGTIELAGERNQQNLGFLELDELEPGTYYIEIGGPDGGDRQIMVISPYTLTIKRSADELFIWAVDLSTGEPVENLPLSISLFTYNAGPSGSSTVVTEPRELGRTDQDGVLRASFESDNPYDPLYIWSPETGRFAFGTNKWERGINPWDFGLPAGYDTTQTTGHLATDRPIYRPEQTVHIRGVVRVDNDGDYTVPEQNEHVDLSITDPEGNTAISMTLPLSEFGTFHTDLPLGSDATLGVYSMNVTMHNDEPDEPDPFSGNSSSTIYGTFTVAEYRPPAFEVTVTPAQPDLVQGETLEMQVSANYFSGGALANAPVRWRLLSNRFYFEPESAPRYRFEDVEDAYEWYRWFDSDQGRGGESISDGTATTDDQGNVTIELPAELAEEQHSRTFILDAEITDVDGQIVAGQGTATVHRGAFYIGLRPDNYVAQAGEAQDIALLTLDPNAQPVGDRELEVGIYQREWFSVREQGSDGRFYFTSTYTDTLLETQDATTDTQGRTNISFTPEEGGSYRIGAEGRDDSGNTIRASAFIWAFGGDTFWGIDDSSRVDLIADKDSYAPGETASVLVTAPYEGMNALMTIERGTVIEHQLLTLDETTEVIEVPITADHAPNIYVSLTLIKPMDDEFPVPDIRVGMINLPVSTEQQELNIDISTNQEQAGPRDEITYTIETTDHTGQGVPAEVSLALVDKAVLALANDPNPTLKEAFYERRPLGVFTANSITALVDRVSLKLQPGDKGGGGSDTVNANMLVRRDFPDTAYWSPGIVTDANGTADVTVALPDSLTTWQMSARGLTLDTRVGQSTQELVSTKPLLVRPSLPRFLTVGDRPMLQAVVHNNTDEQVNATVSLIIDEEESLLRLDAPASQEVDIAANRQAVVTWPALVADEPTETTLEPATLRFVVEGNGLSDAVEQPLPLQRFTTPEVVATAGQVHETTVETLEIPENLPQATDGITTARGEVDLELAPSMTAGVEGGLTYLDDYPYASVEGTVSSFLPNAVVYQLFQQLGMEDQELKQSLEQNMATGLQRLTTLQNLDGGWGWWNRDESNPYLTAYVVQGLLEERKAGYGINEASLNDGIDYLQQSLNESSDNTRRVRNSRSYVLFVLSEAGQPDRGRTINLYEERSRLDIYERAYLLMTFASFQDTDLASDDDAAYIRTLISELMSTAILHPTHAHWEEQTHNYWAMSSDTRTTALALQALVRSDPNNFLVPNAARYLMTQREDGHWSSTQETAASLIALAEYLAESGELEGDYTYRAVLNRTTIHEGTVDRDSLTDTIKVVTALNDLNTDEPNELVLQREAVNGQSGKGRLYYTIHMRYYQQAAAVQPLDRGLRVEREYIAVDTDTLTPTGELISEANVG